MYIRSTVQRDSDKSGILKIFLENLTSQIKILRFYRSKKNQQRDILRIKVFNEMAPSGYDSLDPGPEPLAATSVLSSVCWLTELILYKNHLDNI